MNTNPATDFLIVYFVLVIPLYIIAGMLWRRKEKKLMARLDKKYPGLFNFKSADGKKPTTNGH